MSSCVEVSLSFTFALNEHDFCVKFEGLNLSVG